MSDTTPTLRTPPASPAAPPIERPGLEGVIAATTRLSEVDGEAGRLLLAGFPVEELAPRVRFEEVVHLFLEGRLPRVDELAAFERRLASSRELPPATLALLESRLEESIEAMDALRMGIASLATDDLSGELALGLIARVPSVIATWWRARTGLPPLDPDPELGLAADYLRRISDAPPDDERVRALETYLATVVDHGMNASTFTARVIVSTRSDLVSAVTGALGALKGPLHGGAPGPVLDMIEAIGSPENAEPWLRQRLASGERLMGFGHRVYRTRDPRAEVLAAAAERLAGYSERPQLFTLAREIERAAVRLLTELKPERRLDTNVEFYTALLLHAIGLPRELFTPTFAVGRVVGWIAHAREQLSEGRLMRPRGRYVGERDRQWRPIEER